MVDDFAGRIGSGGDFAGTNLLECGNQAREDRGRGDGNVVSAEHHLYLRGERGQAADGGVVCTQIGFGAVEPDGGGIVRIAGGRAGRERGRRG